MKHTTPFDPYRSGATFFLGTITDNAKGGMKLNVIAEKRELLSGLIGYLGDFESGVRQTVSLFQEGSIDDAKKNTIEVIDGLGWIVEGVEVLRDMLDIDVVDLKNTLDELQVSLQNDDDIMTSDLFENELLPVLATWKQRMIDVDGHAPTKG